jgi:hypothetical protein
MIGFPLLPPKSRLLLRSPSSRTSRERWEGEAAAASVSSPSLTRCCPASGTAQGRLQGVRFDRRGDVSGRFGSSPHRCFRLQDGRGFGYPFFLWHIWMEVTGGVRFVAVLARIKWPCPIGLSKSSPLFDHLFPPLNFVVERFKFFPRVSKLLILVAENTLLVVTANASQLNSSLSASGYPKACSKQWRRP